MYIFFYLGSFFFNVLYSLNMERWNTSCWCVSSLPVSFLPYSSLSAHDRWILLAIMWILVYLTLFLQCPQFSKHTTVKYFLLLCSSPFPWPSFPRLIRHLFSLPGSLYLTPLRAYQKTNNHLTSAFVLMRQLASPSRSVTTRNDKIHLTISFQLADLCFFRSVSQ